MILGTIALISLLFGSGSFEVFFIPSYEEGVKEYVIGKERQKEIASDIKLVKGVFKEFNKERKSDVKQFESMNLSRQTNEKDFTDLFIDMQTKRVSLQNELIDARVEINQKIEPSEWENIVAFAKSSGIELLEKEQKKNKKNNDKKSKDPFENTLNSISKEVNPANQKFIIDGLSGFIIEMDKLTVKLKKVYVDNANVLNNKDATKQDIMKFAEELNELRRATYSEVVSFHMLVRKYTNEKSWEKVMKSFSKELTIPN